MGRRQLYNRKPNLIIMRGLPGSGKSSRARQLNNGDQGVICSTDDCYRDKNGIMQYNHKTKKIAHKKNQAKAKAAMKRREDPVIIDNTNIHLWEMKPYVRMALRYGYWVIFDISDKEWQWDIDILARYNENKVSREVLQRMSDEFEPCRHIFEILFSKEPWRK